MVVQACVLTPQLFTDGTLYSCCITAQLPFIILQSALCLYWRLQATNTFHATLGILWFYGRNRAEAAATADWQQKHSSCVISVLCLCYIMETKCDG